MGSYDSHGDYRRDASLLEDTALPLYKHRDRLPLLPVPSIEESLELLIPSALPLARTPAESDAFIAACKSFPKEANHLQKRLLERSSNLPDSSWLQLWWNTHGYLEIPTPNALHVSYFLRFDRPTTKATPLQRTAAILHATQQYVSQLPHTDAGNLEHPSQRMCPVQYKYLFRSCRIPGKTTADTYRVYNATDSPHAIVAMRGQFFSIPLTDGEGLPLTRTALERILEACRQQASSSTDPPPSFGWLTTQDRRKWGHNYSLLNKLMATDDWDILQSGTVLVAMEDDNDKSSTSTLTDTEQALQLWHGHPNDSSRWHDKSIQVVVTKDGEIAGIIGEHAMADGMPTVGYCRYLQEQTGSLVESGLAVNKDEKFVYHPRPLFDNFHSMSSTDKQKVEAMIHDAKAEFIARSNDYEMKVVRSNVLGKDILKSAGLAPDAAVQMVMQLASSRYFSAPAVATYEAVQTRSFRHGRTETARSVSAASYRLCQKDFSFEALQQACDVHTSYTKRAVKGRGCDRHLLGLELLVEPENESRPQLFDDPLYQRSKTWLISTSTVPTLAPGFGPPDGGFGIGYDVRRDHLVFTISAKRTENSVERYCKVLESAIHDIKSLLPTTRSSISSKL